MDAISALPENRNTQWHASALTRQNREKINGHKSLVIWLTGLSGAGKSTLAYAVEQCLFELGRQVFVLDGDNVRQGICSDLGFSAAARAENIRRVSEVAKIFIESGTIILAAFIAPAAEARATARAIVGDNNFREIYCQCPLEVCEARDIKGLYKKARAGDIKNFTGIDAPYDIPIKPDLVIDTAHQPLADSVALLTTYILNATDIVAQQPG